MSTADEIEKFNNLKNSGAITEEEFLEAKKKLLSQPSLENKISASGSAFDVKQWCLFIHLSQLSNLVVPLAGFILPIVLWQIKKNESELVDQHGKIVANWIITSLIGYAIFGALVFVLIGIPLLFALGITSIVFSVIGGMKANEGIIWPYPWTIKFIK